MGKFWKRWKKAQDMSRPYCTMIVPAAGTSQRMGGENKLFLSLDGTPVLTRTLQAIDSAELVDEIIVAAHADMLLQVADLCAQAGLHKKVRVIQGGASRTESVLAAALEVDPKTKLIAIHDGARPLVRPEMIDALIRSGEKTFAVAPAIPMTDTVKIADDNGLVRQTPDRSVMYCVQTPQVFQAELLKAALQSACNAGANITDDCSAVERLGKEVYLTDGDGENIKITTPLDMVIAKAILDKRVREDQ